ncbi:MAG: YbbR-like domain-containing protein [Lachnospiraceae bacterium]|nr:YbbR-like domain-containing protein [Lachnospiraceae bacterium]
MKNNKLKKAIGIITDNFGLKLLAVIISCGLWFVVNNITDPRIEKPFNNIPVEIINADMVTSEGKVYEVLDDTNVVNVTVVGKRSVLNYISKDDIKAVADMSKLTFMNTVGIEVSSSRNNSELEFRTNIDNVKLAIEDMKRVQMIINTATVGQPAEGYVVGSVTASQNIVRLSGPESLISQIDHVDAMANIDGYSSDINTSVELKLYDADGNEIRSSSIKMNIATVNVAVTILATKEVPLSFTVADEPAEGYVVSGEVISVPETVTLAGRKNVLDAITKVSVADPLITVADKKEDVTAIVNIKKYLPTGTQFADSSFSGNVSVTVGVEPLVKKELEIPAKNFAAGNKPNGYHLTLKEVDQEDSYKITISGTREAVNAVNAEDVIGVIDMNLLLDTLELAEWKEGTYSGEITFNLPDNVKLSDEYKMTVVLEEINE